MIGTDIVLRFFLVERPKEDTITDDKTISAATDHRVSTLRVLLEPSLLAAALMNFAYGTIFNVFEVKDILWWMKELLTNLSIQKKPTLTVRLSTEWGFHSSQIGQFFLAQLSPSLVATPLYGILYDRFGGPKLLCSCTMVVCAIALTLMGVPNRSSPGGVTPLIVLFAIEGFCAFGFSTPALPEIARTIQSQGRARGYAVLNIAFALGTSE